MLLNDIKSTLELGRELGVFPASFKGTITGTARSVAVGAGLAILEERFGPVPADPTAEGFADQEAERVQEGSPSAMVKVAGPDQESAHDRLAQAAMVLRYLEETFGKWEHDEGVRGTVMHMIETNTASVSVDEVEAVFGSAPQAGREAEAMAARKAQLERFLPDVVDLVEDAVANADMDEVEPEWLADAISRGSKNQVSKLKVMFLRGTINTTQARTYNEWLSGMIILQM